MATNSLPAVPAVDSVPVNPVADLCRAMTDFFLDVIEGAIRLKVDLDHLLVRGGAVDHRADGGRAPGASP
jgi:hypothetical protein